MGIVQAAEQMMPFDSLAQKGLVRCLRQFIIFQLRCGFPFARQAGVEQSMETGNLIL
jgi:hypothetical protein